MNYILYDYPQNGCEKSFIVEQIKYDLQEVYSPAYNKKIFRWILGVIDVIRKSSKNDIIVCWFDFQAILCFWICKLFFLKRKIVCINLMLKDKQTKLNKIVGWCYKKAVQSHHFIASVTSVAYGEYLKERLEPNKNFFLLHDVYHDNYQHEVVNVKSQTVFCGGHNGRNWNLILEVAKAMPNVEFHLVMSESVYRNLQSNIPSNVIIKRNIPLTEFMDELCSAELVTLPLNTNAPAGLIVFFRAAANKKYIMTTDTFTTREYLSDSRGCLLPNDVTSWIRAIQDKLADRRGNAEASDKLLTFLREQCSEKKFIEGVELMIKEVQ